MALRHLAIGTLCGLASLTQVEGASVRNRQIHEVDLRDLLTTPDTYRGLNVRFNATFVQTAGLYTPFHTPFTAERFINMVVWDDVDPIWDPQVRAEPLMTLYFSKDQDDTKTINELNKYDLVEITGQVLASYQGKPWIEVTGIDRLNIEPFDDPTLVLLQEAEELHAQEEYHLADQNYAAALLAPMPSSARIAVCYLRGANAFAAREYAAAAQFLDESLWHYENWPGEPLAVRRAAVHYLMAKTQQMIAEQSEQPEVAREAYLTGIMHAETAIALDPKHGDAHAVLGISLAGINELDAARLRCQRAVRMLPDNAEVRWYLGRIYHQQGDHDLAIQTLKRAIDLAPKDYRIHKSIAAVYFDRGRDSQPKNWEDVVLALREYDIAIRLEPDDPDLYYFSGKVIEHAASGDIQVRIGSAMVEATPELAVKRYLRCLAVDDRYARAHIALGDYYRAKEAHDDAITHYHTAVDIRPTDAALIDMLGGYLWELERRADSYAVYTQLHELDPESVVAYAALQRLALELGRNDEGITWGEELLAREATHAAGRINQTELLQRAGRALNAVALGQQVLAEDADTTRQIRAHRALALAYDQLDELDAVVAHASALPSEELSPPSLIEAYAWASSVQDDASQMLPLARRFAESATDQHRALELLGWALYLSGDYQAAETALRPLAKAIDPLLYAWRLGMALFQQGPDRYQEAQALLDKARGLRSDRRIHDRARSQVNDALQTIRIWQREQERAARAAQRADERAQRDAQRAAQAQAQAERRAAAEAQ